MFRPMNLVSLQNALRDLPQSGDFGRVTEPIEVRALLGSLLAGLSVNMPPVEDLTERIGLRRGKVLAVRWDLSAGEVGFKQTVSSALVLFHLWKRERAALCTTIIDGGNVNTALSLAFLADRLELQAEHVLSRHFPADIRDYIRRVGGSRLRLISAPKTYLGMEREFYAHLLELMRDPSRRRSHLCLWHAKYSGVANAWLGRTLAERIDGPIDDVVVSVGSGSTLEGYAVPIQEHFGGVPRIIAAEHHRSRLLNGINVVTDLTGRIEPVGPLGRFRGPPAAVPHIVLGPHYQELNPLLKNTVTARIAGVAVYDDPAWQRMSITCQDSNIHLGNSSAANLACAADLASRGRTVLTFLYEPLRSFYRASTSTERPAQLQRVS